MEEASIKPNPDFTKIIAARAAGSRTAWKLKTAGEQKELKSMFAPSPNMSNSLNKFGKSKFDKFEVWQIRRL